MFMEIITTHKNADFDALASLTAATILYPEAQPVLPRSINPNVKGFLSIHKDIFKYKNPGKMVLDRVNRLIVVDTNRWERLDGMTELMNRSDMEIHLWDHHPERGDITPHWSCQEEIGATTTLFVRLLEKNGNFIHPIYATLFLAGIYEDTGHLTFPSTRPQDARASAFLLEQQADLNVIQAVLRPAYGLRQKEVLAQMLESEERFHLNGHVVCFGKADLPSHTPNLAVVVAMFRDIVNVDATFGIFHDAKTGRCIIIGRSGVDALDIGAMMRVLGGGGRPEAGSASLKGMDPEGVQMWIKEFIQNQGQSAITIYNLMSFPVFTVSAEDSVDQVYHVLKDKGHSGAPVMEGNEIVGIISKRDLNKLKKASQRRSAVKAFMSRNILSISPQDTVTHAVRLMVRHDIGRLPVIENDRLAGIVTRSDVMKYYYGLV
jgi:nanoRNase/pAp phosphatase (c-di-AMP/oligoRNAs hydrolase)/CBS domain-containing protein